MNWNRERQPGPDGWWAMSIIFLLLLAWLISGFWELIGRRGIE